MRVTETSPETMIATEMVTANSRSNRPTTPCRNSTGMNTATSETVIETIVNPTSAEPSSAARSGVLPMSRWRTMFSSITIASSTTNPTASVSASSDRLFSVYPSRCITPNVATTDTGRARLGMSVARTLRRNRKMTSTTSTNATISVI